MRAAIALLTAMLVGGCGAQEAPTPAPTPVATPTPAPTPVATPTPAPTPEAHGQGVVDGSVRPGIVPVIEALPDPAGIPNTAKGRANGDFAPELRLKDLLHDSDFQLGALVGPQASGDIQAVVVGFVASWCGTCRASLPHLKKLVDTTPGVAVVLVPTDEDRPGRVKEAERVQAMGLDVPVLNPDQDSLRAWLGRKRSVPHFFIINRAGEILVQDRGFGRKVKSKLPGQVRYALNHPEYVVRKKAPSGQR